MHSSSIITIYIQCDDDSWYFTKMILCRRFNSLFSSSLFFFFIFVSHAIISVHFLHTFKRIVFFLSSFLHLHIWFLWIHILLLYMHKCKRFIYTNNLLMMRSYVCNPPTHTNTHTNIIHTFFFDKEKPVFILHWYSIHSKCWRIVPFFWYSFLILHCRVYDRHIPINFISSILSYVYLSITFDRFEFHRVCWIWKWKWKWKCNNVVYSLCMHKYIGSFIMHMFQRASNVEFCRSFVIFICKEN